MSYQKPWQLRPPTKPPVLPAHPLDKVRCRGRVFRYVVACMRNCPEPRYCSEFWEFFEKRGVTPRDYYNEDGIGDAAMRRIVIDCDRCGKKDIDKVCALYRPEGEGPEFLLGEDERRALLAATRYEWDEVSTIVWAVLAELEQGRKWVHFCERCFDQVVDSVGKICLVKPIPVPQAAPAEAAKPAPAPVEEPKTVAIRAKRGGAVRAVE